MQTYKSSSSSETKEMGRALGEALLKRGSGRTATVVTLSGELGAGKTTFTKGIYQGLGSKAAVTSPTFIIIRRSKNLFHVDLYRLRDASALDVLAFAEIIKDPKNIVIVEWPELAKKLLPKKLVQVTLHHGRSEHERRITIKGL